jgi:hypothetical protein
MSTFRGSPQVLKSALIGLDASNLLASRIVFQYKPDPMTRRLKARSPSSDNADKAEALRLKGSATGGNHTHHQEFASQKRKNRNLRNRAIKKLATAVPPEPTAALVRSLQVMRTSPQTLTKS